jgi:hypothetical protein
MLAIIYTIVFYIVKKFIKKFIKKFMNMPTLSRLSKAIFEELFTHVPRGTIIQS